MRFIRWLGRGGRAFGRSLLADILGLFVNHWMAMIGYIISFVVPIIFLLWGNIEIKPARYGLALWVYPVLAIFLLVYWWKLRAWLSGRVAAMTVINQLQRGRHAAAIIIMKTIQLGMTIAVFALCYAVAKNIERLGLSIANGFLILVICESVGALFIIADTIKSVLVIETEVL